MSIRVVVVREQADKEALYSFLYRLWSGEFGREMHGMDPERQRIEDDLDPWAVHFMALDDAGEIAGCIRTNTLCDGRLEPSLAASMGQDALLSTFEPRQIAFTSHLAVSPHKRGHTVASRLAGAVIQRMLREDVCVDISYAALNLVHMYYQLGSRPYLPAFRIPGVGLRQPLVYCARDLEHLLEVESPTAPLVPRELDDDGRAARLLRRVFPEFRDPGFDRVSTASLWARMARSGPDTEQRVVGMFDGFSAQDLEAIAPHVVRQVFTPGQYIYRRGEREPGMGVVLSGSLGVALGSDSSHVIAVLGPSQPFGELQALGAGQRSADVFALERSEVMLLPPDLVDRVGHGDPALGFRLAQRLLQVIGQRLVASNVEQVAVERSSARPSRPARPAVHAQATDSSEHAPAQSYAFADFADHEQEIRRLSQQATVVASLEFPALVAAGLRDGLEVLDLGSGPGVFSVALTRRYPGCSVVGVEPEPALRQTALALAERQGVVERCRFVEGTAQRIPLDDDSVDFSYARLLFQHLDDPAAALAELRRVTRPGGIVCVMDADDGSILIHPPVPRWGELEQAIREVQASMGGDRLVGRKLRGLLAQAGLEGAMVQQLHVTPQSIGAAAFFEIGFGFKQELLSRGGLWDDEAQAVFAQLREHVAGPTTYATYAGFVGHGVVPG
jgi:CRP-like cAMP-binding protein/SAM-dependent methyltransferase